jgi:drug/metabolite transporter (DMT)-like permease
METSTSQRFRAILKALLVTFLWSSSYVLTKFGLTDIQPLTLVGLRYLIASLVLVPIAIKHEEHKLVSKNEWWKLIILGFLGYTIAQGLQCFGLSYLPAVTVTLILNFTPLNVMILNLFLIRKYPNRAQITGMLLVFIGAILFFSDKFVEYNLTGVIITFISGLGWAGYMVIGKILFRDSNVNPLGNTAFAMGFGTIILFASAYLIEGLKPISVTGWIIIIWLGIVNTAAAFILWNQALEKMDAFELSILQNTMLIQITLLSMIFLGERLQYVKYIYMGLVFIGVYVVQTRGEDNS